MRILFDQGTPVPLRRYLPGHTIATAFEMGWAEFGNGDLLLEAEAQFNALVTTDQNLRYQQNLANRRLAILVLPSARFSASDRWQQAQDPDYDYSAIHLSEDLGAKPGHFGLAVLPDAELRDRLVNVSGYPVTPGDGKLQYFHANRVKAVTPRRVFYDIDTMGGQSGSPVWAYLDGSNDPVVIGIHAYGVGGTPAGLSVVANSGPRILPEVLDLINTWIQKANT